MRARWEHPATGEDTCTWRRCLPASHLSLTLRDADGQPVGLLDATVGQPSTRSSSPSPSVSTRRRAAVVVAGGDAAAGTDTANAGSTAAVTASATARWRS